MQPDTTQQPSKNDQAQQQNSRTSWLETLGFKGGKDKTDLIVDATERTRSVWEDIARDIHGMRL